MAKNKEPSARQMRAFARKFTKAQWDFCCQDSEFVGLVSTDLKEAELCALFLIEEAEEAKRFSFPKQDE